METTLLLGRAREIKRIPAKSWVNYQLKGPDRAKNSEPRLGPNHIKLRSMLMLHLIRHGQAIDPEALASEPGFDLPYLPGLIDMLEQRLVLVARDAKNHLSWIHPATVEKTPHFVELDDGQTFYASCASAVLEAPYVLGRITGRPVIAKVTTECDHCGHEMEMEIDADQKVEVKNPGAAPLVFDPRVPIDPKTFTEPDIVDAY